MPRSNRRRPDPGRGDAFERFVSGHRRTETRRGVTWAVQPIAGAGAPKTYVCPGCGAQIAADTAHLVIWRADGILGDAADIAARRHWHTHCWKVA